MSYPGTFRFLVHAIPWERGVRVLMEHLIPGEDPRRRAVVTKLEFQEFAEGERYPEEGSFQMAPEDAQSLLDELWRAGLRPSQSVRWRDEEEARKTHLDDMRSLVQKVLDVKFRGLP